MAIEIPEFTFEESLPVGRAGIRAPIDDIPIPSEAAKIPTAPINDVTPAVPPVVVAPPIVAPRDIPGLSQPETGFNSINGPESVEAIRAIEDANERMKTAIDDAADRVIKKSGRPGDLEFPDSSDISSKISGVLQLANDQGLLAQHIIGSTGELGEAAPKITAAANSKAANAINYLASKAPTSIPSLWGPPTDPARTDLTDWWDRYTTVLDPIAKLQAGRVDAPVMETISNVYPAIYRQLQETIASQLGNTDLSYQQAVALSQVIGQDVTGTLSADWVNYTQQSYLANPAQAPHLKGYQSKALDRNKKNTISLLTPLQQTQTGNE